MPVTIENRIAQELSATVQQVVAAVALLDEGATVPFIARYRKEATGGLDDTQLRTCKSGLLYLRELEERRAAILASIEEQRKLTPELAGQHREAPTPSSASKICTCRTSRSGAPRRRSRGRPGSMRWPTALLADHALTPEVEAAKYLKPAFTTEQATTRRSRCQGGARRRAPDPDGTIRRRRRAARRTARASAGRCACMVSAVAEGKEEAGAKFRDYFDYQERSRRSLRIARWPCSAAARKRC